MPFFIRAGKCLPVTATEVVVKLKRPPRDIFGEHQQDADYYRFRLGPEVTLALGMHVKRPGHPMVGENVELLALSNPAGDEMLQRLPLVLRLA